MKRKEIRAVYEQGPEAVVDLIEDLLAVIEKQARTVAKFSGLTERMALLEEENKKLKKHIKELEGRLGMNSRNSHRPPSSDGLSRPPVSRRKGGRPKGGPKGHKGHTLQMVDDPHHVVDHTTPKCSACGRELTRVEATACERRQVFDLPPIQVEVTEHRSHVKTCPGCGCENKAVFPAGVDAPTQYGPAVKATLSYLTAYQLVPLKRSREMLSDLFGIDVCEATILNSNSTLFGNLAGVEEAIKRELAGCPVAGFDETGIRVEGKTAWLHVSSTDTLTCYSAHQKRGRQATEDIGILPLFKGTAVHDFWRTYLTYDCSHAFCCAHILRELIFLEEEEGEVWAGKMKELLIDAHDAVKKAKAEALNRLKPAQTEHFKKQYHQILDEGFTVNPLPPARDGPARRGRKKKSKARNLLERLRDYQDEVLTFMNDFSVPFDNNLAERDLRMVKVQQKISGTFRSWEGAHIFCRIRSYISSVRKNRMPVIHAIKEAFEGQPFMPRPVPT